MRCIALLPILCLAIQSWSAVPSEYAVTDITAWSDAQLAGLPHFDRYVPLSPTGASSDFIPLAHNGVGLTAGNRDYNNGGWVQGSGAYVKDGVQTSVSAWLLQGYWWSYSWSYTWWDGTDYHFQNGFVTHSPVQDVNIVGTVVGYATIPGSGTGAGSSGAYSDHIWMRDTETGEHFDLTPTATRAQARSINDHGQIVGNWSNLDGSHPFIRHPDGTFEDFILATVTSHSLTPTAINNHRLVAGNAIVYTTPIRDQRPWVCASGTSVTQLPFPDQNSPDVGTIADLNDGAILVGEAHKAAAPTETSAVRWSNPGGSWQADDLNELLADNLDFILDRAIAVNDAGHILCTGHVDGADTPNTHRLLLIPDVFPAPAVTTLGAVAVTSTGATFRAKLNACNLPTAATLVHGATTSYGTTNALSPLSGTIPVLAEQAIGGLSPHTTYHFRATANNASGSTEGTDATFTTAWDWPSWAANAGCSGPTDDSNHNSIPDLIDYATGSRPAPVVTVDGDTMRFGFNRSLIADGVTIIPQFSDDLITWHDGPAYSISGSTGSTAHATELSRALVATDLEHVTLSASAHFARLKVQLH